MSSELIETGIAKPRSRSKFVELTDAQKESGIIAATELYQMEGSVDNQFGYVLRNRETGQIEVFREQYAEAIIGLLAITESLDRIGGDPEKAFLDAKVQAGRGPSPTQGPRKTSKYN